MSAHAEIPDVVKEDDTELTGWVSRFDEQRTNEDI